MSESSDLVVRFITRGDKKLQQAFKSTEKAAADATRANAMLNRVTRLYHKQQAEEIRKMQAAQRAADREAKMRADLLKQMEADKARAVKQSVKERDYAIRAMQRHEREMTAGAKAYQKEREAALRKEVRAQRAAEKAAADRGRELRTLAAIEKRGNNVLKRRARSLDDTAQKERAARRAAKQHEKELRALTGVMNRGKRAIDRRNKALEKQRMKEAAAKQALFNKRVRTGNQLLRLLPGRLGSAAAGAGIFAAAILAAGAAIYGIARGTTFAIKSLAEFQDELFVAASAMQEVSQSNVRKLSDSIRELAGTTRFTTAEIAGGAKEWFRAGRSLESWEDGGGKAVATMAALADMSPAEAAKTTSKLMSQFAMTVNDTSSAMDILAAVSTSTPATVKELGTSMKFVGGIMNQAGVSFADTTTLIGALSTRLEAGQAARGLRTAMMNLLKPGKEARETLKRLGLSVDDLREALKNPPDFARMLSGISEKDLAKIFPSTRGLLVIQTLKAMEEQGMEVSKAFATVRSKGEGLADAMRKVQDLSLGNQLKILWSRVTELAISVGEQLEPSFRSLLKSLFELVTSLDDNADSLGEFLQTFVRGAKAVTEFFTLISEGIATFDWLADKLTGAKEPANQLADAHLALGEDIETAKEEAWSFTKVMVTAGSLVWKVATGQFAAAGEQILELAGAFNTEAEAMKEVGDAIDDLEKKQGKLSDFGKLLEAQKELLASKNDVNPYKLMVDQAAEQLDRLEKRWDENARKAEEWARKVAAARDKLNKQARTADDQSDIARLGLTKGVKSATSAAIKGLNAINDLSKVFGDKVSNEAVTASDAIVRAFSENIKQALLKNPELASQVGEAIALVMSRAQHGSGAQEADLATASKAASEAVRAAEFEELMKAGAEEAEKYKKSQAEIAKIREKMAKLDAKNDKKEAQFKKKMRKMEEKAKKDAEKAAKALREAAVQLAQSIDSVVQGVVGAVMGGTPTADLMTMGGNALVATGDPLWATIGMFVNALAPFIAQVESLSGVTEGLTAMWENMIVDLLPNLEGPVMAVAGAVGTLAPLFSTLGVVLDSLTPVFSFLALVVGALGIAINAIIYGIYWLLDLIPGLDFSSELAAIEQSMADQAAMMEAIATGTVDELLESMVEEKKARDESTESLKEFNEELSNVPSGYKRLKLRQYENSDPLYVGGIQPGSRPRPTVSPGARGIFNRRTPQEARRISIGWLGES